MKVALIADPTWLREESAILSHLVVGLTNEQVRVVPVVPHGHRLDRISLVTDSVEYRTSHWRLFRRYVIRRSLQGLRDVDVDLVHSLDGSMVWGAIALARALDVPAVCSCWSVDELSCIVPRSRALAACTMATEPLLDLASERVGQNTPLRLVRPGVLADSGGNHGSLTDPDASLCCLVLSDGQDDYYNISFFDALVTMGESGRKIQLFIYTGGVDKQRLWHAARRRDLLGQVNFISGDPATRRLALQADVLIQLQPTGRAQSIVIQAMASGMPVIAAADQMVDYLIEGTTARLVTQISTERWADCFAQLVKAPGAFIALGKSAKQYVKEHHSAFGFVSGMLNMYQQVTGAPIPFEQSVED